MTKKSNEPTSAREAIDRLETWLKQAGASAPRGFVRKVEFGRVPAPRAAEKFRERLPVSHSQSYIDFVTEYGSVTLADPDLIEPNIGLRIIAPNQASRYDDMIEDAGMLNHDDRVWDLRTFAVESEKPLAIWVFDRSRSDGKGNYAIGRWCEGVYDPREDDPIISFDAWVSNWVDNQLDGMKKLYLVEQVARDVAEEKARAAAEARAAIRMAEAAAKRAAEERAKIAAEIEAAEIEAAEEADLADFIEEPEG